MRFVTSAPAACRRGWSRGRNCCGCRLSHVRRAGAAAHRDHCHVPPNQIGGAPAIDNTTYRDLAIAYARAVVLSARTARFDIFQFPFRFNPGTNGGNVEMGLIDKSYLVTLNQRVPGSSPCAPTKFHQPTHRLTRRLVYCRRASFDGRFHPGSTVRPLALLQHVTCALAPITASQRSSATSVSLKRAR